jgi:hypothetical protein
MTTRTSLAYVLALMMTGSLAEYGFLVLSPIGMYPCSKALFWVS